MPDRSASAPSGLTRDDVLVTGLTPVAINFRLFETGVRRALTLRLLVVAAALGSWGHPSPAIAQSPPPNHPAEEKRFNTQAFHEDCKLTIGKRFVAAVKPKYLRIAGFWYPRGGIPIDVFWQMGRLPKGVWLTDPGISPYRGRG